MLNQKKYLSNPELSTALSITVNAKNGIEEKIIDVLSKHPEGITIIDISRDVGAHRNTVSKYIFGLVKEGVVTQRRIGVVSICYLSKKGEKR